MDVVPFQSMRILVACEESQTVTKAFRAIGHEAYSCDIQPCSGDRPEWHKQADLFSLEPQTFDMIVAFPPCTHLSASGARYWNQKQSDGRQDNAIEFFLRIWDLPVAKIAIENPIGIMSKKLGKPTQVIQPYEFGHNASKKTCLWLRGLPKLEPTEFVEPKMACCGMILTDRYGCPNCKGENEPRYIWGNQTASGQNKLSPSEDRAKIRSKTYQGIADAMASQWSQPGCAAGIQSLLFT